ncbi:MAG: GH32 C-terminal domain-containing protein [Pirellula sp.]|nr:GH32 C-terminal domain-containing protein [Pirellula sp.]
MRSILSLIALGTTFLLALESIVSTACVSTAWAQDPALHEKTLVVWVSPANLEQRAGSALTLEDDQGNFDGVVFAELAPRRWMAGSEIYRRTHRDQSTYPEETSSPDQWVQMAIVYAKDRITLYRNGVVYASHPVTEQHRYPADSVVLIGPRHQGKEDIFAGQIDDARIYAQALGQAEIAALLPNVEGSRRPWAWWTFDDEQGQEKTGRIQHSRMTSGASIRNGKLHLDGTGGFFASSNASKVQQALARQSIPAWLVPPAEDMRLSIHLMHPGGDSIPGDPNPAFALDGQYHLHYILGHPHRGQTSFSFVHVTSRDMLHWEWQTTKLQPSFTGHGMFSGTGFITREGKPAAIYHGQASGRNQIAIAKDNQLSSWEKPFPIEAKTKDGNAAQIQYWDPDCFLIGDTYYAISGGENPPLMKSQDLKNWTLVGDFLAHDMPDVALGEDISCPNFFPLGNKWVLLCISHPLGCRYYIGNWDADKEQFVPERHGRLNWRRDQQPMFGLFQRTDFFAPESLLTPDGRRVMWAWLTSVGPDNRLLNKTIQSLPRELRLAEDGSLRIAPIREMESLRLPGTAEENVSISNPITGHVAKVPPSESQFLKRIAAWDESAAELRIRIRKDQALRKLMGFLLFSDGKGGGLPILLRPETGSIRVGDCEAPFSVADLPDGEDVEFRIFIDNYLVEVFVNDRQSLVSAYFGDRTHRAVDAFTVGATTVVQSIEAWPLQPTQEGFLKAIESRVWAPETK